MRSALLVLLLLFAGASAAAAADATVTIKNFNFAMDVTVTPGSTVIWTNLDGEPHTVASVDGLFRSPALDQNDSFRFTFDKPGVYKYICSIHPRMKAAITVK
jgi:plastocyanin